MKRIDNLRVDAVFHDALDLPRHERCAFLGEACANNECLRREIESLLAAHEANGEFLEQPVWDGLTPGPTDVVDDSASPDPSALVGQRIGRYMIDGLIAVGGMGAVYKAVRADEAYRRQVAIKFIRRGVLYDSMRHRFRRERQTLANLQHPYITQLIDVSSTEDGVPYLVMEFVEGEPIDSHCDHRQLDLRARVTLFRMVCDAVHYAHQNLIVHRDLKPSNVLITEDGRPKLLDFGIAKLLDQGGSDSAAEATVSLLRVCTPRYASPEQIRGEPVTTASDVYSLGVLLYELLCGHRPYRLSPTPGYENERVICEEEPVAPSVMTGRTEMRTASDGITDTITPESVGRARSEKPTQLQRHLKGDLDNIVLMAMQKDPRRRYASVRELSEDLRRYLEGLPVMARKDTLVYRATKLVKRNKGTTVVSVALLVALLVGIAGTTLGLRRAQRARHHATVQRNAAVAAQEQAQSVASFLQEILAAANPYRTGRDASVLYELLDDASERVETQYAQVPATEAAVRYAIANTLAGLWRWNDAEPHLRRALEINRELHGDTHAAVADCLILLGRALTFLGKDEAVEVQREALAIRRRLFPADGSEVAWAKTCLAFALWHAQITNPDVSQERLAEAERLAFEALAVQRRRRDTNPMELAISLHTVAAMLSTTGTLSEAAWIYDEALEVYRSLPWQKDRYLAECVRGCAATLRQLGQHDMERRMMEEYVHLTPATFRSEPAPRRAVWRLAHLFRVQAASKPGPKATESLKKSIVYYQRALLAESDVLSGGHPEWADELATLQSTLTEIDGGEGLAIGTVAFLTFIADHGVAEERLVDLLAGPGKLLADLGLHAEADEILDTVHLITERQTPGLASARAQE